MSYNPQNPNGQATMANSSPVVIASDQSTVDIKSNALVNAGNSSTTLLGAGGNFVGSAIDMLNYSTLRISVYSDKPSAANGLKVQFSSDGVNWDITRQSTYLDAGTAEAIVFNRVARYARVNYTNGATPQTAFRLQALTVPNSSEFVRNFMGEVPVDSDTGILTQSVLVGKTTAGGGGYVSVKVNPSGALTADVSGSTVGVTGTVSVSNTVNATVAETAYDINPTPVALTVNKAGELLITSAVEQEMLDILRSTNKAIKQLLVVMSSVTAVNIPSDSLNEFDVG